jgi:hypothetical protein
MSDIRLASDDNHKPLLFGNKENAGKYASDNYGFGSRKATLEMYNYKVIKL